MLNFLGIKSHPIRLFSLNNALNQIIKKRKGEMEE